MSHRLVEHVSISIDQRLVGLDPLLTIKAYSGTRLANGRQDLSVSANQSQKAGKGHELGV